MKELERIKAQTQENPSQLKQVKKDYHDFMDKYKKEIKEKEATVDEANKKVSLTPEGTVVLNSAPGLLKTIYRLLDAR